MSATRHTVDLVDRICTRDSDIGTLYWRLYTTLQRLEDWRHSIHERGYRSYWTGGKSHRTYRSQYRNIVTSPVNARCWPVDEVTMCIRRHFRRHNLPWSLIYDVPSESVNLPVEPLCVKAANVLPVARTRKSRKTPFVPFSFS